VQVVKVKQSDFVSTIAKWAVGLFILVALAAIFMTGTNPPAPRTQPPAVAAAAAAPTGCQPHVELHDAKHWARELGQTEMTVQASHRINIRSSADTNSAKVGELPVGARAVILEEAGNAYRVWTYQGQTGWLSKIQVARTLFQDVASRKPCTPGKKP
jgi:hypothetical protein